MSIEHVGSELWQLSSPHRCNATIAVRIKDITFLRIIYFLFFQFYVINRIIRCIRFDNREKRGENWTDLLVFENLVANRESKIIFLS